MTPRLNTHRKWLLLVGGLFLGMAVVTSAASKALFIGPVFLPPRLALPAGTETLIVGASHSACTFDPARFRAADSIARHGELVFFTYAKLRAVLDRNPGVRTVLLAFAPIHLAGWQDEDLLGGNTHSRAQFMDYYMLLDDEDRATVSGWRADDVLARLKYDYGLPLGYAEDAVLLLKYATGDLEPGSYEFWGGYTPIDGSHLGARRNQVVIDKYFFDEDGALAATSAIARDHIEKILQLTTGRGIRTILVNTPLQALFRQATPPFFTEHYSKARRELLRQFPSVEYLDLSDAVADDALFLDADHLNATGSAGFSERLAAKLDLEPDA